MNAPEEIITALTIIYTRLDTLASITSANILAPDGPQERYHQIIEEAYAALGKVETAVDQLQEELEYQHKRLDEVRNEALTVE